MFLSLHANPSRQLCVSLNFGLPQTSSKLFAQIKKKKKFNFELLKKLIIKLTSTENNELRFVTNFF